MTFSAPKVYNDIFFFVNAFLRLLNKFYFTVWKTDIVNSRNNSE